MANYNNYFPQNYPNGYNLYGTTTNSVPSYTTQAPAQPISQNNGIVWVQGEAAARAYVVPAGSKNILMDSETNVFYVKSSDASGMPLPLRIFEYKELTENSEPKTNTQDYITKEEFEQRISELEKILNKEKPNEQFAI